MGICPKKFGPYFWGALHLACLFADDYKTLRSFVYSYTEVLPCPMCREHFAQVVEQRPFPSEGHNIEYFTWSVDVHNIVNQRLGAPMLTYDEAFAEWISGCDPAAPWDKYAEIKIRLSTFAIIVIIIFLIVYNSK